jgi:hypothetical protein
MYDAPAILWNTARLSVVVAAGVVVGGLLAGNQAPLGFHLTVVLILAELALLTATVPTLTRIVLHGGSVVGGVVVLQGRLLLTAAGLLLLARFFGGEPVMAGLVATFAVYILAALFHSVEQLPVPLESL